MAVEPILKQSQHWSKEEDCQLGRSYTKVGEDLREKIRTKTGLSWLTIWEAVRKDFVNFAPPLRRDGAGALYAERTAIALSIK